jgi:uracil-DNA glycosylase
VKPELARIAGSLLEHVELQRQLGALGVADGGHAEGASPAQASRPAKASSAAAARGAGQGSRGPAARAAGLPQPEPAAATARDGAGQAGALADIGARAAACTRCRLAETRTQVVFGAGAPDAELLFVGEAPGRNEDLSGQPFVGEAGQLLDKIVVAMGLTRGQVYICNILKCRPPGNRNPLPDEIEQCEPYLLEQLGAVAPRVIVALGTFAARALLRTEEPISRLRGKFFRYHEIELMPTYHPAYLLRNPSAKRVVWEDMQKVQAKLGIPPGSYAEKGPYRR